MKDFRIRFSTGLALAFLSIFVFYLGEIPTAIYGAFAISLCTYELVRSFQNIGMRPYWICLGMSYAAILLFSWALDRRFDTFLFALLPAAITFIFDRSEDRLIRLLSTYFMIFYPIYAGLPLYIPRVGLVHFWIQVLAITIGADVFAYLGGSIFGKHPLCPKVSPKKTIEGAISGLLGAMILGSFAIVLFPHVFLAHPSVYLPVTFFAGILAQLGDLFASGLKRRLELKDFGSCLPGHGGVLDRLDSVLFVSYFLYTVEGLF